MKRNEYRARNVKQFIFICLFIFINVSNYIFSKYVISLLMCRMRIITVCHYCREFVFLAKKTFWRGMRVDSV